VTKQQVPLKQWFLKEFIVDKVRVYFTFYHREFQAYFGYGGLVLGLSRFSLLFQLPQKQRSIQKWSKLTLKNNHHDSKT